MGVNITKDAGDLSLLGEASGVIKRVVPSGPLVSSNVAAGKFPELNRGFNIFNEDIMYSRGIFQPATFDFLRARG